MPGVPPDFLLIGADYRNSSINPPGVGGGGAYLISSFKEGSLLEGGGGGLLQRGV